jgi:hypothetical protein
MPSKKTKDYVKRLEKAEQEGYERSVHPLEAWLPIGDAQGPKFSDHPGDPINPGHYKAGSMECIDVIEAFRLNFHLGNAAKYILRAGKKGDRIEDLRKAAWYIDREIKRTS